MCRFFCESGSNSGCSDALRVACRPRQAGVITLLLGGVRVTVDLDLDRFMRMQSERTLAAHVLSVGLVNLNCGALGWRVASRSAAVPCIGTQWRRGLQQRAAGQHDGADQADRAIPETIAGCHLRSSFGCMSKPPPAGAAIGGLGGGGGGGSVACAAAGPQAPCPRPCRPGSARGASAARRHRWAGDSRPAAACQARRDRERRVQDRSVWNSGVGRRAQRRDLAGTGRPYGSRNDASVRASAAFT